MKRMTKMEDKRIQKTKKNLKETLVKMLSEKPFEKISVTEICKEAQTSRITFYTYYGDKYELLDEVFRDMEDFATERYAELQQRNNPARDPVEGYCNLLNAILDMYYAHIDFFRHADKDENPYLYFSYYCNVLRNVEKFGTDNLDHIKPKFPLDRMTSFICNGIWGYIQSARADGCSIDQIKKESTELIRSLLTSDLFKSDN